MAAQIARSKLFGMDEAQTFTLMLLAHSKGLHPIQAVERYHVIQGRPAMKADAMLAEFQSRGGVVTWGRHDHEECDATFASPGVGQPVTVSWSLADAKKAELLRNTMWSKYPRQMLRARVISEGIRMTMPGILSGIYTPEEVADFAPEDTASAPAADAHHAKHFDNNTGHGSGAYAAHEVIADYKVWARGFVTDHNERWDETLDRAGAMEHTPPAQLRELINPWQLTNHLFKWARERKLFNAPGNAKQDQKPKFLCVGWEEHRERLIVEAEEYVATLRAEKKAELDALTGVQPEDESQETGCDPDGDIYPPEPGSEG